MPELLLPITTSSMNLALRFHQLRSLSKGFRLLGRQELVGGPPVPLRVRDGAANGEPPALPQRQEVLALAPCFIRLLFYLFDLAFSQRGGEDPA